MQFKYTLSPGSSDTLVNDSYGTASKHQKPILTHGQAFPYNWQMENWSTLLDGPMWTYACMERPWSICMVALSPQALAFSVILGLVFVFF